MKKLLLLLSLLISFSIISSAQFKFGTAAGLNFANFSNENTSSFSSVMGMNAGFIFEIKLPIELGVEADVFYSTKGSSVDIDYGSESFTSDYSLKYIDIPLVAKLYMLKVTNLQLGLQYSYLLGANNTIEGVGSQDVKNQFSSGDIAAVLGFGVDVSKLHFSTRYNFGLTDAVNGGGTKNNMLTFSIGIWLKK